MRVSGWKYPERKAFAVTTVLVAAAGAVRHRPVVAVVKPAALGMLAITVARGTRRRAPADNALLAATLIAGLAHDELFIDPSYTYRLDLHRYRPRPEVVRDVYHHRG